MTNDLMIFEQENKRKAFLGILPSTTDDKKKIYNAMENCDKLLNDCVNETIEIKNIYVEQNEKVDDATGEVKTKFRTILFDNNDKTYATGSFGVYNAIVRIMSIYGVPSEWNSPIRVKVVKRKMKDDKSSLSLELL